MGSELFKKAGKDPYFKDLCEAHGDGLTDEFLLKAGFFDDGLEQVPYDLDFLSTPMDRLKSRIPDAETNKTIETRDSHRLLEDEIIGDGPWFSGGARGEGKPWVVLLTTGGFAPDSPGAYRHDVPGQDAPRRPGILCARRVHFAVA